MRGRERGDGGREGTVQRADLNVKGLQGTVVWAAGPLVLVMTAARLAVVLASLPLVVLRLFLSPSAYSPQCVNQLSGIPQPETISVRSGLVTPPLSHYCNNNASRNNAQAKYKWWCIATWYETSSSGGFKLENWATP
ncbi:hypothetical protein E2C01_021323 [Portunus trituberculatus]|uniref:Uncharacterized protein n=1 Tax=Portunus trituberculatus TaxID=210409 RepID=A0A5B7E2Z2_PORTR|nr:hypothetical protein [Portunus trituberculatus]